MCNINELKYFKYNNNNRSNKMDSGCGRGIVDLKELNNSNIATTTTTKFLKLKKIYIK